jgi:4'-phosphopantetheinyl transferase
MMIKIYFTENKTKWHAGIYEQIILLLPPAIRDKISAYKGWQDRQSRILGKWMLIQLLKDFRMDITLDDLTYTSYHKPNLPGPFHFSIAHSADMVVCAATMDAEIGIDIELVKPVDLKDFQDYLTSREWKYIQVSSDPNKIFYQIWTKKEALLKALGRGIDLDPSTIEVLSDPIQYDRKKYSLHTLSIIDGYTAALALSDQIDTDRVSIDRFSLSI